MFVMLDAGKPLNAPSIAVSSVSSSPTLMTTVSGGFVETGREILCNIIY
jgi:hypothetical protein